MNDELIDATGFNGTRFTVRQQDSQRWYRLNGTERELPSCTTIIDSVWGPPFPPEAAANAEYARKRGQELHRAAMFSAQNRLDKASLDPDVAPRLEHYEGWCARRRWKASFVEQAFWDQEYGFACTPDQVGVFDVGDSFRREPRLCILEIKPATAPYVGLQTMAAAMAVRRCLDLSYTPERIALFVTENGANDVLQIERRKDRAGFLAALTCFNYGIERKLWK